MQVRLLKIYQEVRASYWFLPLVLSIVASCLAFGLVTLDETLNWAVHADTPFFFATQPEGARALLSAIGGSMIGVAGTVFSVTMAAVVYASGSYGPRLLTNFMNDRGNQLTLGTFTATFVYCILVLRTVRSGSDADADIVIAPFVPVFATFGATVLGLCSIGVLIFFIHHVPSNIHISRVIAGIGRSLLQEIDSRFPKTIGKPRSAAEAPEDVDWQLPAPFRAGASQNEADPGFAEVAARESGYVQIIDEEALIDAARRHEVVVRLNLHPGTFLHPGAIAFDVWPAGRASEEAETELLAAIGLGDKRTPTQDLLFLFDELVEIAARALSPGVNDPYTAITCIDWMGAAIGDLCTRSIPDALRLDEDDKLRVIVRPTSLDLYLRHSFGNLRQYASGDMLAAQHFITRMTGILRLCAAERDREALYRMVEETVDLSRSALGGRSLAVIEERVREFRFAYANPLARAPMEAVQGAAAAPATLPA